MPPETGRVFYTARVLPFVCFTPSHRSTRGMRREHRKNRTRIGPHLAQPWAAERPAISVLEIGYVRRSEIGPRRVFRRRQRLCWARTTAVPPRSAGVRGTVRASVVRRVRRLRLPVASRTGQASSPRSRLSQLAAAPEVLGRVEEARCPRRFQLSHRGAPLGNTRSSVRANPDRIRTANAAQLILAFLANPERHVPFSTIAVRRALLRGRDTLHRLSNSKAVSLNSSPPPGKHPVIRTNFRASMSGSTNGS
jgi:hypothetical protein